MYFKVKFTHMQSEYSPPKHFCESEAPPQKYVHPLAKPICIFSLCEFDIGEHWLAKMQRQSRAKMCVVDPLNGPQTSKLGYVSFSSFVAQIQHQHLCSCDHDLNQSTLVP